MPPVGFEPPIPASERPQTHAVDRADTGIGALTNLFSLTLRLLMSYTYGTPSKARSANVVYIWTYVWQR